MADGDDQLQSGLPLGSLHSRRDRERPVRVGERGRPPALRELEERGQQLEALRAHLAEGAGEAGRGDFVDDLDIEDVIARAKARA